MATATSKQRFGHAWALTMTIGVLWIVFGAFALFASVLTSYVSVIFIAVLLLVVGVMELISAFRMHRDGPFLVYLLAGLLAIVVGALFLYRPLASLGALTLLVAGYLFASGLFRGISAVFDRYPRWGWDFAYGIVAILLGAYIVRSWPLSAFWVLGTIVSVEIIARGVAMVAASWAVRDIEHKARSGEFAAV
jgi:uncharacterized membrane protein HdeD (DUF308 family)